LLHFSLARKKHGLTLGLYRAKYKFREADHYINFTLHNASYIMKRDGVKAGKIESIGNPSFDTYFNYFNAKENIGKTGDYFLLIDAPYCEQEYFKLEQKEKIDFYEKLNALCQQKNKRLVVKLHPLSYNSNYFPQHKKIEYLKEANIAKLICEAEACFMINFSTLSPLAMIYAPIAYFNTRVNLFDAELSSLNLLQEYDFHSFETNEIVFTKVDEASKKLLINKYLYKTDGKATERLKQILLR